MTRAILFEDEGAGRFEPVALTRAVGRLRLGLWTHRERWARVFPGLPLAALCRGYLAETERAAGGWQAVNEAPEGEALFVSAALGRPDRETAEAVRALAPGDALLAGGRLVAARAAGQPAARLARALLEVLGEGPFPSASPDWPKLLESAGFAVGSIGTGEPPSTLADLVAANAAAIEEDFEALSAEIPPPDPDAHPGAHLVAPERIRLGAGVRIDPGSVLDAREGPIVLGEGVHVMAGCLLTGPLAAGARCRLRPGARLHGGVSLGPVCRVGGELHGTVIQGFSNKQHDGFLGHSYLGCWVNLGAATDTSDLKNDYGPVRLLLAGGAVETGRRNVGSLIGDHTKTAIHTRLNTGTVLGVSANVLAADFPDRETPSFTWGGGERRSEYRLEKALRVAATVTARRGVDFSDAEARLFETLHRATRRQREAWLERARWRRRLD